MAFVRQREKADCGVAALAMLCDVEYEAALKVIPFGRKGLLEGTTTKQLTDGAKRLNYIPMGFRLHVIGPNASWKSIPDNSLVKTVNPDNKEQQHWVVWRKNKIYDPAMGVFKPEQYHVKPTSYLQFLKCKE